MTRNSFHASVVLVIRYGFRCRAFRPQHLLLAGGLGVALVLFGCAFGPLAPVNYQFVDTISSPRGGMPPPLDSAAAARNALDPSSLERDVRYLASAELQGRLRGTEGNARARAYIVGRLRAAGLAALFDDSFEQGTYAKDEEAGDPSHRYGTNVGAILPAADPSAEWIVLVAHYDHRGVIDGEVQPGADDNASSVALLLALADALGRTRPTLRRHVVFLFPDAEEPPDIRTERMGSSWFWRHPPFPADRLHCALVLDLMGGQASPELRNAGLGDVVWVLGAEASPGLMRSVRGLPAEEEVEPVLLSLAMIEARPYVPWRRYALSDYYGLRKYVRRPFLFLTTGRTETYHTAQDTPETLDYEKLARVTRWVTLLATYATEGDEELGWRDLVVDPWADAQTLLRLYGAIGDGSRFPSLLRHALAADRSRVQELARSWAAGEAPSRITYRELLLASLRLQAAMWHPSGWWFALW